MVSCFRSADPEMVSLSADSSVRIRRRGRRYIPGFLLWYKQRKRVQQNELVVHDEIIFQPRVFQHRELAIATGNFSEENKLGQGGFGPVYQGYLRDLDRHVAIKVLSHEKASGKGLEQFKAEIKALTQLRHRNIVQLVGWCSSREGSLLVYELMAGGSLEKHLHNAERILTWQERYKIILDLGSALLYLHQECEKCIVHGDIKPENVMLDASRNCKLGDFGLARLIEHGAEPQTTQITAGTFGYVDPALVSNPEADLYSFGVVLLEIACGKRPTSRQPNRGLTLLQWVRDLYDQRMILDAADGRLNGEFDQQQMERVLITGLCCANEDPSQRPSIAQAMDVLRSAATELPMLPATQHVRCLVDQTFGYSTVEYHSALAVTATTHLTSKDSAHPLSEE